MNNCHLNGDILEIIISFASNPWVWFTVNKCFFTSNTIIMNILSLKIRRRDVYKFYKLRLSCGIVYDYDKGYDVSIFDPLAERKEWYQWWIYGYEISDNKIIPIIFNENSRFHNHNIDSPLSQNQDVDARTMFYILCRRITTVEKITGVSLDYQKAREYALLYMQKRLENLRDHQKYLLLMMYARVMGLSTGLMKLKIESKDLYLADHLCELDDLEDYLCELDEQIKDDLPKLEDFVSGAVLRLNYDVLL